MFDTMPKAAINNAMQVKCVTGVVQQAPMMVIPPGAAVYVRPLATNAAAVVVANSREECSASSPRAIALAAGVSQPFPCDHTGQIFIMGTTNDAVTISVLG